MRAAKLRGRVSSSSARSRVTRPSSANSVLRACTTNVRRSRVASAFRIIIRFLSTSCLYERIKALGAAPALLNQMLCGRELLALQATVLVGLLKSFLHIIVGRSGDLNGDRH